MTEIDYLDEFNRRVGLLPRPRFCYLEIPALDAGVSASFYESVFGWDIRDKATNRPSFIHRGADLTGAWVTGRAISQAPGVLPYIWVDDIAQTLERIESSGGKIADPPRLDAPEGEWIATFRDPAGNVMGLYQERPH